MNLTKEEITGLLKHGEGVHLECKLSRVALAGSLWDSYSAFANTTGGVILLGVKEEGGSFFVQGVENPERQVQDFLNTVHSPTKCSADLIKDDNIQRIQVGDATIIAIYVPPVHRHDKPIYIKGNPYGGTFIRRNEGDYKCSPREVDRMIAEKFDTFDDRICNKYTLADLDQKSFRAYRQRFLNRNVEHPFNDLDDKEFLTKLGGYAVDREAGKEGLTLAGLLMFGDLRAILDNVPAYIVDYREYAGESGVVDRWIDRITTDATWSGNIFDFSQKVIRNLFTALKTPFALDENMVRVDDSPAHIAVREAVVNTLIHANYNETTAILITKWPDRFEFRNPGTLRINPSVQGSTGSDCRNRAMQKMFQFIGYSEQAGSGYPKILKGCRVSGWAQPFISDDVQNCQTFLTLKLNDIPATEHRIVPVFDFNAPISGVEKSVEKNESGVENDANDLDRGANDLDHNLDDLDQHLMIVIAKDGTMTYAKMAECCGVSVPTVQRHLTKLQKLSKITRIGPDHGGHWEVIK